MLTEIKNKSEHCFVDELGRYQGESKAWHSNGVLWCHRHYVDGKLHGESKIWYSTGVLSYHEYYVDGKLHGELKSWDKNGVLRGHQYYVDDVIVHGFLLNPLTDIEKMLLVLKHGGKLLPRGGIC